MLFSAILEGDALKDIKVLARGNSTMVPAAVHAQPGKCMLVIHNHPSGDVTPSGADITVASRLAREGIGFAIINNSVSEAYILVEPVQIKPAAAVPIKKVSAALDQGGYVARIMPTYEDRPQQLEMALNVANALNEGAHALAEAGTGIGKSLAYLVPVIMWASENNRRAVVSTNTINLQEQLLYKDIPLLHQALPFGFKAVLVKGRANYLCKRKFYELCNEAKTWWRKRFAGLAGHDAMGETTRDGSRSEFDLPSSELGNWFLQADSACVSLSLFRTAFPPGQRETLMPGFDCQSQLVFADIALRSKGADTGVLPEYHCIILDEAHNAERAATDWLGARVTRLSFSRLLARLYNLRGNRAKGLLVVLENKLAADQDLDSKLVRELLELVRQQVVPNCMSVSQEANEFFEEAAAYFSEQGDREVKLRLPGKFAHSTGWEKLRQQTQSLFIATGKLEKSLAVLRTCMDQLGPQGFEAVLSQAFELDGIRARLKALEADLQEVMMGEDESLVRWTELMPSRRGQRADFCYAPLTVSQVLKENLWEKFSSVVLTSATMTVNKSFDYIRDRLGLDRTFKVKELQYESPFNYRQQVRLGIATDLPDPAQPAFQAKIIPVILESLQASRGRGLVLFTSFSLLKTTAEALREELSRQG